MSQSKFECISIDGVELDKCNPRIAKFIEMFGANITDEGMGLALGAGDSESEGNRTTFNSLKESIRTNGGVIHPIIVSKHVDGKCIVIEGNTRTLIYREFRRQKVEGCWDVIPAMIYEGISQSEIDAIRLQAHLVGPRDWDPYSKAKYLDHLRNAKHLTMNQIVDFCGGRKREVMNYISAYQEMESFYRPLVTDDEFDQSRFSAFVELQSPRVRESLLRHKYSLTNYSEWVRDGLFSPMQTIRQLPRILENPKCRAIFLKSGAAEAMKVLETPAAIDALKEVALEDLAREMCRRVMNMPYRELQRLREDLNSEENSVLCEARDQFVQVCKDIASDG